MTASATPKSSEKKHPALSAAIVSSVKERLWEETALGVANTVGTLREAWYTGSSAVFYTREREQFEKYISPFQYGLAATVFLFVNFRVTGSIRFQQWRKGVWSRFRPRDLRKKEPSTSTQQPPTVEYLETERRKKAMRSMRFLTDTLISLAFGTTGTLFLLQAPVDNHLRDDFETAPLLAGHSVVASEMCPGMLKLYQSDTKVRLVLDSNSQIDGDGESKTDEPLLATFSAFVQNCQKRADHEARLRKDHRSFHSGKAPVLIPHTGVQ